MVGLAFAVAASANFPALLLALTWRRFNTAGAVTGVLFGVISAIVLVIVSPKVWPGADTDTGSPIGWTLANPGIVSIPLGFIGCYLGTVLSKEHGAERTYHELYVRSETGLGAEQPLAEERELVERDRRDNASGRRPRAGAGCTDFHRGGDAMADGATLESQIGELLDQETFDPPKEFAENARRHRRVDRTSRPRTTSRASGPSRPRQLHWYEKWDQVLDWSDPPNAKWFAGGKLNVAYNCVDRHVEAGNGDRVAFHWRGEEGEELDVTYADLHRDVQKFANALKDHGIGKGDVVGIFLPMIPEVAVAMLACARIGADPQRRLRRLLGRVGQGADGVLRGQGARHRRRRPPQGQDRGDQGAGRRGHGRREVDRDDLRRQAHGQRRADDRRPRRLVPRGARGGRRRVRGRAVRRRAPALHPLLVGLDGQAEGHPAHDAAAT